MPNTELYYEDPFSHFVGYESMSLASVAQPK